MKTSYLKFIFGAALLLLFAVDSKAQEKKTTAPAAVKTGENKPPARNIPIKPISRPDFPEALQNLTRFLGRWSAAATLEIDGKTNVVDYHFSARMVADRTGLMIEEFFNDTVLGKMQGANLAGYSKSDSKIHWLSVGNMDDTHEHIGEWISKDHFHMENNSTRNGKKFVEKIDFVFKNRDEVEFKLVATLDDKVSEKGNAVFHREMPAAKEKPKSPAGK